MYPYMCISSPADALSDALYIACTPTHDVLARFGTSRRLLHRPDARLSVHTHNNHGARYNRSPGSEIPVFFLCIASMPQASYVTATVHYSSVLYEYSTRATPPRVCIHHAWSMSSCCWCSTVLYYSRPSTPSPPFFIHLV